MGASRDHIDVELSACDEAWNILRDLLRVRGSSFDCEWSDTHISIKLNRLVPGYMLVVLIPDAKLSGGTGPFRCYMRFSRSGKLYIGL